MKKYIYFVSIFFVQNDGITGYGMGEQHLDEEITTSEQLQEIVKNALDENQALASVSIVNYQLLRYDVVSDSRSRWN